MDNKMVTPKSHDIYELVPQVKGLLTLYLTGYCTGSSKVLLLTKIKPGRAPGVTTDVLGLTVMNNLPWRCGLSRSARFSP